MYKFYFVHEKVYDKGKRYVSFGKCFSDKKPEDKSHSCMGYIDYYWYFYTQEAAQNYIRDNKVA